MSLFMAAMRLCDDCMQDKADELRWWGVYIRICAGCREKRIAALPAPPPEPLPSSPSPLTREEVAGIIDPSAEPTTFNMGGLVGEPMMRAYAHRWAEALAKADAILARLSPLPAEGWTPDAIDLFEAFEASLVEGTPTISLQAGRVWVDEAAFDARTLLSALSAIPSPEKGEGKQEHTLSVAESGGSPTTSVKSDSQPRPDVMREVAGALKTAQQAINDWVCTYADDMVGETDLRAARARIHEAGGTLAYTAEVSERVATALTLAQEVVDG